MVEKKKAAGKQSPPPAPEPKPAPKPVAVTFVSPARGKRVYDVDGRVAAKFVDGEFTTSDESLVAVLDGLPDVRRAE